MPKVDDKDIAEHLLTTYTYIYNIFENTPQRQNIEIAQIRNTYAIHESEIATSRLPTCFLFCTSSIMHWHVPESRESSPSLYTSAAFAFGGLPRFLGTFASPPSPSVGFEASFCAALFLATLATF